MLQRFTLRVPNSPVHGIYQYIPGSVESLPHEHRSLRPVQVRYLYPVGTRVRPVQLLTDPVYGETRGALQAAAYYLLYSQ